MDKRSISCPVCNKGKFIDIENSRGKNSVKCDRCHRFIILDWDTLTAKETSAIKSP